MDHHRADECPPRPPGPAMSQITVNQEPHPLPSPATVAALLARLGKDPSKVAVEVNRDVVPRARHAEYSLAPGDEVEIVTLVGGGSGAPAADGPLVIGPFRF